MKIILIGYGKMGQEIEQVLLRKGHICSLKITSSNMHLLNDSVMKEADVAIEFTTPSSAVNNIKKCIDWGIPVVTGSTGWYHDFKSIKTAISEKQGSLFYATNFSIGVNIFFKINELLAALMHNQAYEPSIWEEHHIHKKDHPSGTGVTLAERIIQEFPTKKSIYASLENEEVTNIDDAALHIVSSRKDEVPGTHTVSWIGTNDAIELKHEAFNRKGFAEGAVVAAEWLVGKKGIYTMTDLLKL